MTHHVATYTSEKQYERWQAKADDVNMSMSQWVSSMVEAGTKKFEIASEPDYSQQELQSQIEELHQELQQARTREDRLSTRLYEGERGEIKRFVESNGPVTVEEIIQHLIDTVPSRVVRQLDEMDEKDLTKTESGYQAIVWEEQ